MCKQNNKHKSKKGSGPFRIFLSMGCKNPDIFRKRFYIDGFQTIEEAINFANRLDDFIIANAEFGFLGTSLWVVRPLGIIPPVPNDLMTKARIKALEMDTTSIEALNNFGTLLNQVLQQLGLRLSDIEEFKTLVLTKK